MLRVQKRRNHFHVIIVFFCPTIVMAKTKRWSLKYKKSIDCKRPKGFSQKQHCKYGKTRKK